MSILTASRLMTIKTPAQLYAAPGRSENREAEPPYLK
jgi:hypothetical protein